MPFIQLHKLSTYLLAFTGFLAVLLPNELHPLTWLIVLAGLGLSWRVQESSMQEASYRSLSTNLTVGLVVGLLLIGIVGIYPNPVLIACYILVILQLNKLFNRTAHRDYTQIYVLSFLMLTIGTILNNDITYAITFVFYVIFITWTLTLFHLRREIEGTYLMRHSEDLNEAEKVDISKILQSRRLVRGSYLGAISIIALFIFASSSIIFFLFPRIGFGLFFQRKRVGPRISGFSNKVNLGSFGKIRLNRAVVMRIELPNAKKVSPMLDHYWRGGSYDLYDGKSWKRSLRYNKLSRFYRPDEHHLAKIRPSDRNKVIKQVVYQEPMDVPILFGIDRVYKFSIPTNIPTRVRHMVPRVKIDMYSDRMTYSNLMAAGSSIRYNVWSVPNDRRPLSFRKVIFDKKIKKIFLQLPESLDKRIPALARDITRGETSTYGKIRAVQTYLQNNYKYSLQRSAPVGTPMADFLFRQKKGHCEYFSSAMAILLRTLDIPTRQVTGFYTARWNSYGKYYVVRQSDAHSWVEVFMPKGDWKRFDPTPSAPSLSQKRWWSFIEEYYDSLRLAWYKWIIEYDLENQLNALKQLRSTMARASQKFEGFSLSDWWKETKANPWVQLGLGGALFLFIGFIGWWLNVRRRSYPKTAKAVYHLATQLYMQALKLMDRKGIVRNDSETPSEFVTRVHEEHPHLSESLALMTEHYLELRYNPESKEAKHHIDGLYQSLEQVKLQLHSSDRSDA